MKSPFPKRFYASHTYGWADCPRLAKEVWMRIREPEFTWYATDMEVLSPTSIKLFVYDIADTFHGGIGSKIFETVITEFTPEETTMLNNVVLSIYTELAMEELERREARARELQVINLRKEMFGV